MKKKQSAHQSRNLYLVGFFCVMVALLVLCAMIIRFGIMISQSKFDGHNRFTVLIVQNPAVFISFNPIDESISILSYDAKKKQVNQQEIFSSLKIPLDSVIQSKSAKAQQLVSFHSIGDFSKDAKVSSTILSLFLSSYAYDSSLTVIDWVRLIWFSQFVRETKINADELSINSEESYRDGVIAELFSDEKVKMEKVSIAIVNGTSTPGLGIRLEKYISHMGGNVVSVTSSEKPIQVSTIASQNAKYYTVEKLSKQLQLKIEEKKSQGVSDIIIYIGENIKSNLLF